jgi:two-component system sensor histidine kinase CiaH
MVQLSKQSGASVTSSDHSVFFWARLKLIAIYVCIVGIILLGFSLILFQNIGRNLNDADEGDFAGPGSHQHFVTNTLDTVGNELIFIDLIILAVSAGVSYVLAGYTLRPIQVSMEAQKKFAENASHELRTPLAVMKNDAEVLLRNPYPTKELIHATLRSNVEEIDRMTKMAEDLLLLARSENRKPVELEELDLNEVTQKVTEKMEIIAKEKGLTLNLATAASLPIQGNRGGLERVLVNLLQNSIQHTSKGGAVCVETMREDSKAVLKVTDTGAGIDEKDLPHLFERFYKGDGASGSGLGLSIVKELVDQHSGDIEIVSAKGKGTTVTVQFSLVA